MGNTISDTNGDLNDTVLANMINEWALNKYKMDLPDTTTYKNLLKKRACCTKQTSIPISIPSYDEQNKKLEFSSVNINVFSNEDEITAAACSFENDRYGNKKQYYFQNNNGFIISNQNCATIYPVLCNAVLNDRQNYDNDYTRHYGAYPDTKNRRDNLNKVNTFIDCNCNNSLYLSDLINAQTANNVNPNTLAQSLDTRCSMNSTKTFKTVDDRIANLCLNNINVTGDIGVNNDAQLGITQSCSAGSQQAKNQAPAQQGPAPAAEPVLAAAEPVAAPAPAPAQAQAPAQAPAAQPAADATQESPVAEESQAAPEQAAPEQAAPEQAAPAAESSQGTPVAEASQAASTASSPTTSSNKKIYIIVGSVVALICIIIAIMLFMRKK
jgi:hypothetical protein